MKCIPFRTCDFYQYCNNKSEYCIFKNPDLLLLIKINYKMAKKINHLEDKIEDIRLKCGV